MSESENNSSGLVHGAEMTDAPAEERPELDRAAALAMEACTDPSFDAGPMYEQAGGVQLSASEQAVVDAHLKTCLHCRLVQDVFAEELRAHAARDEAETAATLSGLLRQAGESAPKEDVKLGVHVIPFPIWGKQTAGLLSAAAVMLAVGIALRLPVPPAEIEATAPIGAVAETMAMAADGGAMRQFAPSGVCQVTVRLVQEAPTSAATPRIYAFFERDGRLVALPDSAVVSRKRTETWVSMQLAIRVGDVLGEAAGLRRLLYASTRTHDLGDLEGLTIEEALEDDSIAWVQQEIEIVSP